MNWISSAWKVNFESKIPSYTYANYVFFFTDTIYGNPVL